MHEDEARPEAHGLLEGLLGEPAAADAFCEAEVVADVRARSRLAADTALVDHERAQPVGCAVDGRREPGWARADDDEVELVRLEIGRGARRDCDLRIGGIAEAPPIRKHHQRKPGFRARGGQ